MKNLIGSSEKEGFMNGSFRVCSVTRLGDLLTLSKLKILYCPKDMQNCWFKK